MECIEEVRRIKFNILQVDLFLFIKSLKLYKTKHMGTKGYFAFSFILLFCAIEEYAYTQIANTLAIQLNGTWTPVMQEFSGKLLPTAAFETQKLIINDSTYIVVAESVDKGIIKYSENRMDIFGKDGVNSGKHFTALYKYENEQLTICYNLSGNDYPEAFETKSKPYLFISVFKRSQ